MGFTVLAGEPAWARYEGAQEAELDKLCRYRDERAAYALKRWQHNAWKLPDEERQAQEAALKAAVKRTVRREDGAIPAGLVNRFGVALGEPVQTEVEYPSAWAYPWFREPDKVLRDYQEAAVTRLLDGRHVSVALCPGAGKTLVALHCVQRLGLSAVVCSPFEAIVRQTYREFRETLGPRLVGMYGGGRKDVRHPVLIATTQAILAAKGGARAAFEKRDVLIGDECHTLAADRLSQLCYGVLARAPYRLFMSGTVLRTDGLQLLLDGIVGPVVAELDTIRAQEIGVLTPTAVRILEIFNPMPLDTADPQKATQEGLFRSKRVNAVVGELVGKMVDAGRPTLVMVDELDQFMRLLPNLRHEVRFAHAAAPPALKKAGVPERFWKCEPMDLVDQFNAGKFPVLVGTSCVGTGVDVRACGAGVYLRGGRSEIDVRQTAGRFMRRHPGKSDVVVFDVDVMNAAVPHRHAVDREEIWRRVTRDVRRVRL